jgi:hypothetical protein
MADNAHHMQAEWKAPIPDAEEVTQWFREECMGKYELFFDERSEAEGNVLRFYFRFHDIGDALKFKLQFGHNLDAGAAAE